MGTFTVDRWLVCPLPVPWEINKHPFWVSKTAKDYAPIATMHSLLAGHRCKEGEAKNTYGTGCFLLLNTGTRRVHSTHGLITGVGYRLGPQASTQYMLEGTLESGFSSGV